MAYEQRPGSFSIFKNEKKEKDTHPDYKGDGMDLTGTPVWISAWIKEGKNGKFMSCSMKAKEAKEEPKSKPQDKGADKGAFDDFADDIPF